MRQIAAVDGYLNSDGFANFFAGLVDGGGLAPITVPYWVSTAVVLAPVMARS